jgi:hypothetical protein
MVKNISHSIILDRSKPPEVAAAIPVAGVIFRRTASLLAQKKERHPAVALRNVQSRLLG